MLTKVDIFIAVFFVLLIVFTEHLVVKIITDFVDRKKGKKTISTAPAPDVDSLVILPAGDKTNGLGTIFGQLFRQVFEQSPERVAILERMNVAIGIQDTVVESTALTMTFRDATVTIENGVRGKPDIYIEGDIETLVKLPGMARNIKNILLTEDGREIVKKIIKGELKAKGVFANIGDFRNFRRLVK